MSVPTLTLAETDGITYAVAPRGPHTPGQPVTVTATLRPAGVGWPAELPPGWTETSATTATFELTFDTVTCTPVAPVAPGVTQATCVNGAVAPPRITLPGTTGVLYVVEPSDLGDGSTNVDVMVTATVEDGFGWATISAPWVRNNDATATLTLTLPRTTCDEVMPVAPTVTQAECANGALSAPTLALLETDGITYSVDARGPVQARAGGDGDGDVGSGRGRVAG